MPTAKVPATGNWYQAAMDPNDDLSGWPTLNPTGLWADPPTHSASNGSFTDAKAKTLINKACQQTSITPPTGPEWNSWTKAEKYAWLRSVRNALYQETGIYLDMSDNEAVTWEDAGSIVAGLGLKPRRDETGGPA